MTDKMFVLLGGSRHGEAVRLRKEMPWLHMVKPIGATSANFNTHSVDVAQDVELYERRTRYTEPGHVPYTVYVYVPDYEAANGAD